MLTLGDSTASLAYLYDPMLLSPPAIIRVEGGAAPEGASARTNNVSQLIAENATRQLKTTFGRGSVLRDEVVAETMSPDLWVWDTVDKIAAHRNLPNGWVGAGVDSPSQTSLDVAEFLATGFSYLPINRRPDFGVDAEGFASYSMYEDGFYLHLTIDQAGVVSWYSVENNSEHFQGDVVVDPFQVRNLAETIMSA